MFIDLFHKWRHPHCIDCQHDKECKTCDTLRDMLEAERFEKKQLLNRILELTAPKTTEERDVAPISNELREVRPKHMTWKIRKELLEQEDRERARLVHLHKETEFKTTEELEKELGVEHAG